MSRYVRVGGVCPGRPDSSALPAEICAGLLGALEPAFSDRPDFLLLPECCDIPAGLHGEKLRAHVADRGGATLEALSKTAREHGCALGYATLLPDGDGGLTNAIVFIGADGFVRGEYHKNHPMIEECERDGVRVGNGFAPVDIGPCTVGGLVCFDLNFADVSAGWRAAKPDILAFSSMFHGGPLQSRLAYDCARHLVTAVSGLACAIYDPLGGLIAASTNYTSYVTAKINLDCGVFHLDGNAPKLRELKRRYGGAVEISDPGLIGSVILYCGEGAPNVAALENEFGLERRDDYFARARRFTEARK